MSAASPAASLTVHAACPAPRATCLFLQGAGQGPLEPHVSIQGFSSLGEVDTQSQFPAGLAVSWLHCGERPSAASQAEGTLGTRLWPAGPWLELGGEERSCLHRERLLRGCTGSGPCSEAPLKITHSKPAHPGSYTAPIF